MATSPNFSATLRTTVNQVSTANTNRDGTGTIVTCFTAGTNGSRIEVQATGTTTVGMVRLFLNDGTNTRLLREVPIAAITPSGTVPAFQIPLIFGDYVPLLLPTSSWSLRAATNNAETFNITVYGGDF